jgi:hypothetical protein
MDTEPCNSHGDDNLIRQLTCPSGVARLRLSGLLGERGRKCRDRPPASWIEHVCGIWPVAQCWVLVRCGDRACGFTSRPAEGTALRPRALPCRLDHQPARADRGEGGFELADCHGGSRRDTPVSARDSRLPTGPLGLKVIDASRISRRFRFACCRALLFAPLMGLCSASSVGAHDFWVQPNEYWVRPQAVMPLTLQVGHGPFRQRSPIPLKRIYSGACTNPQRMRTSPGWPQ